MDDRTGVHQRRAQGIADTLDHGIGRRDDRQRSIAEPGRKHPGRQARCPYRYRDLGRAVLAGEVRQGAGLGKGEVIDPRDRVHDPRHRVAAERARRQEYHLARRQMRRHCPGDVILGEGGAGDYDQLGAGDHLADIVAGEREFDRPAARGVGQRDPTAVAHRCECGLIAPPKPHLVALLGEIGSNGVGAVAAAEDGDTAHLAAATSGRRHRRAAGT